MGAAGTSTSLVLVQALADRPELTASVILSTLVLALLLYVLKRVNAIPAEEGLKRHDVVNRMTETIAGGHDALQAETHRMEARLLGAIEGGLDREATERRTFDQRLLELERELPRRGDR